MPNIKTSKGVLHLKNEIPPEKSISERESLDNIKIIKSYLDKIGINWGPVFGTLIGIVRNDSFLPWENDTSFYILKEDEERFKDQIWNLLLEGFIVVRYERRGLYCLERNKQWHSFYVLRKISPEIRHSGGTQFLFDKFLQNTTEWDFKGLKLNVPTELDEFLTFQYGDWMIPQKKVIHYNSIEKMLLCIKDHLPNSIYYSLLLRHHTKDFKRFKQHCAQNGLNISSDVELSYLKPRKHKKVLTVGVYDLIHKGHVELFRRAKSLGDYLVVAVQSSEFISKYKPNSQVLNSTEDRMYMVRSIKWVDEVVVYEDVDEFIKIQDFDLFVAGPDQIHSGFKKAIKWCEENGKEFIVLGRTDGVSSSELKAKITEKMNKI